MIEDRWADYSRAELVAKRSAAQRSCRLVTITLAAVAVGIMIFNAGMGTPFLMHLGAPAEIAWLGPLIADAGMVITLVGTKYLHGEGAGSGSLMCGVWGTAVMSCVLTAGGSVWPARGPANVVAAVVFASFPLLLVLMAHGAAGVQRHAAARTAELDHAIRAVTTGARRPASEPSRPAVTKPSPEPASEPAAATVTAEPVPSPATVAGLEQGMSREATVPVLVQVLRSGGKLTWRDVQQGTGQSKSFCEKALAAARAQASRPHLVEATQ